MRRPGRQGAAIVASLALACLLAVLKPPVANIRNLTQTSLTVVLRFRGGARPEQTTLGVGEMAQLNVRPDDIASIDYRGSGLTCRLGHDDLPGVTTYVPQLGPIVALMDCRGAG